MQTRPGRAPRGCPDAQRRRCCRRHRPSRLPMMFYTAAVNGVFAFFFSGGLLLTAHGVTPEFLLSLLFYIIITPVISLTLTRMMYMSESKMVVDGSQNGVCRSAQPASGGRFAEELQPAKKHPQRHCRAVLAHVQSAADAFYACAFTGQCRPGPEWSFCRPPPRPASRAPGSIPSGYHDRRWPRCGASAVCRWFHRGC